jgi:hypothetical protein
MRTPGVFLTGFLLLILLAATLVFGRKASPERAGAKEQTRPGQIATADAVTTGPGTDSNSAEIAVPGGAITSKGTAQTATLGHSNTNTAAADPEDGRLRQEVLRQIGALEAEKAGRTQIQKKMDSQLIYAAKMEKGEPVANGVPTLKIELDRDASDRVLVDIKAEVSDELLKAITTGGGQVVNSFKEYSAIRAKIRLAQAEELAGRQDVTYIEPAARAVSNVGSVTSEGDIAHRANVARTTYSVDGTGVKVGVLSDSVDHLAESQASNDLGPVTVLDGQSGVPANGEGTAMLEIVHDLAPGAGLYYATAFNGPASFANNIRQLQAAGCDIIVDDVYYFNETPFQDGIIAHAVNDVTANGALFFSSAGNSGNKNDGQSGVWEGDFMDSGQSNNDGGRIHGFGAANYNTAVSGGSAERVDLFWADPLGSSANDYDVYITDSTGNNVISASTNPQNGSQDPYERINKLEVDQRVVVVKYSGAVRYMHLATGRGRLAFNTGGQTKGHSCAANAFCVAAVSARNSSAAFTSNYKVETFTSDGLRRVFFNEDGSAITPGNFTSTGGAVRQKPDIAAADGVKTTLPADSGLNPFYGTSAAAPHAGAVAALLKSFNRNLTAAEMRALVTSRTLDIESTGTDRDAGYGIVMADLLLQGGPISGQPTIAGFAPASGTIGSAVTITGTKFTGGQAVKFNGVSAVFNVDSATQISATVPANATTGPISVTTPGGTATSAMGFGIITGPAITSFTPSSGSAGTSVIIIGANLSGATSVSFGAVAATTFVVNSPTQITVIVPAGTVSGKITVTTPSGTTTSAGNFTVTSAPVIAAFNPSAGAVGTAVTISGANFVNVNGVAFNGVTAVYTVDSASQITATVPAGASTGPLRITTAAGTAVSVTNFAVVAPPIVTNVNPSSGSPGTVVTISGSGLSGATSVTFNGLPAAIFSVASSTQIIATVPVGASSGPVRVTTPGGMSAGVNFTVSGAPANDNFAAAQSLTGGSGTASGSTVGATREIGEPEHVGNPGGNSIWYRWSAPTGGACKFDTIGSSFDTLLAVYTGTSLANLTHIAANDDIVTGISTNSQLSFIATAGTVYYIAIDGFSEGGESPVPTASGSVVLHWTANSTLPTIGGFSPGSGVVGASIVINGANLSGATMVTFNGVSATFAINSSAQITANVPVGASSGPLRISTPAGTATSAANFIVLTPSNNDNFANGLIIAGTSGTTNASNASASKEAGEPNHAGNAGGRSIWFTWTAPSVGVWTFDTFGSGIDTLLAVYAGNSVNGLTPVASGDDWNGLLTSQVSFTTTAGVAYRIAVDGYGGAGGDIVLNWSFTPDVPSISGFSPSAGAPGTNVLIQGANFDGAIGVKFGSVSALTFNINSSAQIQTVVPSGADTGPITVITTNAVTRSATDFVVLTTPPVNDNFANRITIVGATRTVLGSNAGANKETNEPNHANQAGGKSVWWTWTPPASGTYSITTRGSEFDTLLGIYTGSTLATLTKVASDDDGANMDTESLVTFDAVGGTTYQVAVDGYGGDAGNIVLSVYPDTASQTLYYAGFEPGEGYTTTMPLAGQKTWSISGVGQNGISFNEFGDNGYQAYLGFSSTTFGDGCLLWPPVNHTPAINSRPVVIFSTYMQIVDSTNGRYDLFDWNFYNRNGDFLCSLEFDNFTTHIGYQLNDGAPTQYTGRNFNNGEIYYLEVTLNFASNRWSATLDGTPLIEGKAISTTTATLDLGDVDAGWFRVSGTFGDNYMAFDDYWITAEASEVPRIITPPASQSVLAGSTIRLFVVADSPLQLAYQWQFNGIDIPGATGPVLDLYGIRVEQAGNYRVVVKNAEGVVVSAAAQLSVVLPANLGPYRPDGWSEALVLSTSGAITNSPVIYSRDNVFISWAVINDVGHAPVTNRFYTQLFVDGTLKQSWSTSSLDPDFYTFATNYSIGQLTAGTHVIRLETDATAVIPESDETDNSYTRQIVVSEFQEPVPVLGSLARLANGAFQFTLSGTPSRRYEILGSTNLTQWSVLATLTNANPNGLLPYIDQSATNLPRRFYRGRMLNP